MTKTEVIKIIATAICAERGETSAADIAEVAESQGLVLSVVTIGEIMFDLPFIRTGKRIYAPADISLRAAKKDGVEQERIYPEPVTFSGDGSVDQDADEPVEPNEETYSG